MLQSHGDILSNDSVVDELMEYILAHGNFGGRDAPTGIVKKCAVREYPKSEIDRYQAAW